MCNSIKGTVKNTTIGKRNDVSRKNEFLTFPLITAGSKTQIF